MASNNPSEFKLKELTSKFPQDQPLYMLNLLRFNEQANYPEDMQQAPCSGAEAYSRYGKHAAPKIKQAGAELIWSGNAIASVIAPNDEVWDQVILVRYPSVTAFIKMISDPEYQAIAFHRTAALADTRLIANSQAQGF